MSEKLAVAKAFRVTAFDTRHEADACSQCGPTCYARVSNGYRVVVF